MMESPKKKEDRRIEVEANGKDQYKKCEKKGKHYEYMKEYMKEYRNRKRMMEASARKEALKIEVNEIDQKNRRKIRINEYNNVYMREYRKIMLMMETPEEKAARLKKDRDSKRQKKKRKKGENDEQTKKQQERLLRLNLLDKIRRHFITKQKEDLVRKDTERKHLIDQKQIEVITLKQCKENITACIAGSLPRGKDKAASQQTSLHTSDSKIENIVIKQTGPEINSKLNQDTQQDKSRPLLECPKTSLVTDHKFDSIKCTKKSLVTDHKFDSIKTTSTMENCISNKNSNSSYVEDAFGRMRKVIDLKAMQDRYSIYGKHLANQIRKSGKSDKEICIAKQLIDDVIKKLYLDYGMSEKQIVDFKSESI